MPQMQDRRAAAPSALAEVYRAHFSYVWHAARRVGIPSADLEERATILGLHQRAARDQDAGHELKRVGDGRAHASKSSPKPD
ncbi:MAG: hypothetical protein AB2A00_43440 [Myxococcota bacterium]